MRTVSLVPLGFACLLGCGPAWSAKVAPTGGGENACFGGPAQAVTQREITQGPDDPDSKGLLAVPGRVVWRLGDLLQTIDLSTGRADQANDIVLKATDPTEAFGSSVDWQPRTRYKLVAVNYQTGKRRIVLDDQQDPWLYEDSQVVLDGDFAYFSGSSGPGERCPYQAFYRMRRDGTGQPERLGSEPCGTSTPFLIEDGYVYWSQNDEKGPSALWRRPIARDSQSQRLTVTQAHHLPLALGRGRLFYIDAGRILSVPLDGSAPPTEHIRGLDPRADAKLLVDRDCLYWTTGHSIMRANLGSQAAPKAEMIADEANYHGGPIATDGQQLYWVDQIHHHLLRVGRSGDVRLPRPTLLARTGEVSQSPVDGPDATLVVGDGWGCAHVLGWREPTLQCWRAQAGAGPIKAKPVPWRSPPDVQAGPDRLCYLDRTHPKCWPWPDFTRERPEGVPQAQGKTDPQVLVGGSFACAAQNAARGKLEMKCEGDNTYGQLAQHGLAGIGEYSDEQIAMHKLGGFGFAMEPWALGTWHGCLGRRLSCWGRGDAGQLGFAPQEKCQTPTGQVPCSRDVRPAAAAPEGPHRIYAGDMFTCAASNLWTAFSCWGASRDGWFGSQACPPALREAWPTLGASVKAPNAKCSASPASIPEFDRYRAEHNCNTEGDREPPVGCREYGWPRYSVGPRGACMLTWGALHCVGAIATPTGAFDKVVVGPGAKASACGLAQGQVLCWGEDYSPAGRPGTPVAIAFEQPPTAVVDFPAPAGTTWSAKHLIHRSCGRIPLAFPKCPAATGEPWSALAPKAAELRGKTVSVKDRLIVGSHPKNSPEADGRHCDLKWKNPMVGPLGNEAHYPGTGGTGCYKEGRPIVLGAGESQLAFAEDAPAFDCIGDESRLCCGAQAFGQTVVAQGVLDGSNQRGWVLKSASVCEPQ